MECNGGGVDGFVRFRAKEESKPVSHVIIPQHFRAKAPDPSKTKKVAPKKEETSKDHAAAAKKLQEEVEKLDAERETRMKALLAKRKASKTGSKAAPPPPPAMTFGSKKRRA